MRRWPRAGCFERIVEDVQSLLRLFGGRKGHSTAVCLDSRTLQPTPESGARAGYDGAKRRKDSKIHIAADTLGRLMALTVTPADLAGRRFCAADTAGDRQHGRVGLCRPRRHRPGHRQSRPAARHPTRGGKAPDGQTRLRPAAQTIGGGEKLRLGRSSVA